MVSRCQSERERKTGTGAETKPHKEWARREAPVNFTSFVNYSPAGSYESHSDKEGNCFFFANVL